MSIYGARISTQFLIDYDKYQEQRKVAPVGLNYKQHWKRSDKTFTIPLLEHNKMLIPVNIQVTLTLPGSIFYSPTVLYSLFFFFLNNSG